MADLFHFTLGDLACTAIREGGSSGTPERFYGNAPAEALSAALAENGVDSERIPLSMNVLLLDTGRGHALIDTGVGADVTETAGFLMDGLAALQLSPDEIAMIILTHADRDHIGGLLSKANALIFPNANVFLSQEEWDFVMNGGDEQRDKQQILNTLTAAGRLTRITGETRISPEITMLPAPGHKPGHYAVLIESNGERLLHIADAAHTPLHFLYPDWSPKVDVDIPQAVATRKALLQRAADENLRMMAYHLPFPGIGRVSRAGDAYRWLPEV